MLCQFTFRNFKSYKNEAVLDLQATKAIGFNESLLQNVNDEEKFLPVSVIYGPNAGGKSNVIEALKTVVSIVTVPIRIFKNKDMNHTFVEWYPFEFDEISCKKPTEFELYFRPNGEYEYRYIIKVLDGKIVEESLYRCKVGSLRKRIVTIFERVSNSINLGSCIKKTINTNNIKVNEQMPFLSFLAINYSFQSIDLAIDWFERCIMRNYARPYAEKRFVMGAEPEFKKQLINLMNDVGINISDFEFVKKSDENEFYDIFFEHEINGQFYKLNFALESDGTQKLFNVLPLIILALSEGRLLALDELDAKLHPKLLKYIIMLFKNPNINKKNAQLIFTSHDVSTMKSSVFRTDEIWFACKLADESSELYSLFDIKDENNNHIQPSAAFDKQYLEGRYGADPYFQNMMDWK